MIGQVPENAIGLKLYRINQREELIGCEPVYFVSGRDGVDIVLRRSALSGRVEIEGDINDHYADFLINRDGEWDGTVALDAKSYSALKNHWMRCKTEPRP